MSTIPAPRALTKEILQKLPFKLHMHVNGGSKFSKRITRNADYGLCLVTETDGSPGYNFVSKRLVMEGEKLELELLTGIPDYDAFCTAFNALRSSIA